MENAEALLPAARRILWTIALALCAVACLTLQGCAADAKERLRKTNIGQ